MATLLFSCSSENYTIEGKWISLEESQDTIPDYLSFSTSSGVYESKGVFSENYKGTFIQVGDSILLSYHKAKEVTIDSMGIAISSDGSVETNYYSNEKLIAKNNGDEISSIPAEKTIQVNKISDAELYVEAEGQLLKFKKEVVASSGLSFMSVLRGILGMMSLILLTYLFSGNKKKIDWALVGKGVALQLIIAILVLKVPFVDQIFLFISEKFVSLISFTDAGIDFLFGQLGIGQIQAPLITFAIKVLPTIIFFSALMSMLYYMGILQKVVYLFAWMMKKFMRLSGAETLAAAGNIFLGQTESPLLVKPYLMGMTKSEIMCLMTGGMATIAGGVLAAYVGFLGGDDPVQQAFFAKHLLTASIISAPAAIVAAKILVPETEPINEDLKINKEKLGSNILEAISNGTSDGLRLAVNVGAMLLVFTALMALGNGILDWVGDKTTLNALIAENTPYNGLSFQFLLGYIGAPIVWLMGVDGSDIIYVGELLGQKTVLNEFIAYPSLGEMKAAGKLSEKSIIMSTYMLCGFANFASIGIQIGGIGSLVPSRKGLLSKLGMKALIGGTVASLMTAAIVGMLY